MTLKVRLFGLVFTQWVVSSSTELHHAVHEVLFHPFLLSIIEHIVFFWVLERLIILQLVFEHSVEDLLVLEFFLQAKQSRSDTMFVLGSSVIRTVSEGQTLLGIEVIEHVLVDFELLSLFNLRFLGLL